MRKTSHLNAPRSLLTITFFALTIVNGPIEARVVEYD